MKTKLTYETTSFIPLTNFNQKKALSWYFAFSCRDNKSERQKDTLSHQTVVKNPDRCSLHRAMIFRHPEDKRAELDAKIEKARVRRLQETKHSKRWACKKQLKNEVRT